MHLNGSSPASSRLTAPTRRAVASWPRPDRNVWLRRAAVDAAHRRQRCCTIADLFTVMAIGTLIIWIAVVVVAIYSIRFGESHSRRAANLLIIGGGVIAPTIVLGASCGVLCRVAATCRRSLGPLVETLGRRRHCLTRHSRPRYSSVRRVPRANGSTENPGYPLLAGQQSNISHYSCVYYRNSGAADRRMSR